MMKRKGDAGSNGEGDDGDVAERARRQRELFDPQTQGENINFTDTSFAHQRDYSQSYEFDASNSSWADDPTLALAHDIDWSSAVDSDWLDTPPVPAPCQSGIAGKELPAQPGSIVPVCYGMVI